MGTGATASERSVVWAVTAACVALVTATALASNVSWNWWQWGLVFFLAVDVGGGVTANALSPAKRLYHTPSPSRAPFPHRVLRNPVGFSALHIHPFGLLLLPDVGLGWAAAWYSACLAGTVALTVAPVYLQRPMAFALATVVVVVLPVADSPAGLGWLGPAMFLKLVLAHAVREEPYRPVFRDANIVN